MKRTIIHADLDAFYASVEQLDHPELRGRPVVVGGSPDLRGVVAAASYEARRFGIHSAMPMREALRRCPEAVRLPPRFDRYRDLSRQVMEIFRSITDLVEPLSLDEAFLDVTDAVGREENCDALGRRLKLEVKQTTGLTISVGGGSNKTVAKVASDAGKPDGLVVVPRGQEAAFLDPLPTRALWGIGPKAEARLASGGIHTVGELARAEIGNLEKLLGSRAALVQGMAQGIDERLVETTHERKSVGAERTFPRDLPDGPELRSHVARIAEEVGRRLERSGLSARQVSLKLRYRNFHTITRQVSLASATNEAAEIRQNADRLLDRTLQPGDLFRLLGIHCSQLTSSEGGQPRLLEG